MGKKELRLRQILSDSNLIKDTKLDVPNISSLVLQGCFKEEVLKVYHELGGLDNAYDYRGRWDIVGDKFIIELDEQLHFNYCRLKTFNSSLYRELKSFPTDLYKNFCCEYNEKCLRAGRYGRKWGTQRSISMFGLPDQHGDFSGNSSPRWKQRAFYDFVKDVSPLATGIPVARLSIYDTINYQGNACMLGSILERDEIDAKKAVEQIIELINQRLPL